MLDLKNPAHLFLDNGWTLLTPIYVLLFSLLLIPV